MKLRSRGKIIFFLIVSLIPHIYSYSQQLDWGEKIFSTRDPSICWDGTYRGLLQPNGNYAYYLKVSSDCGVINEKGLITLIK